MSRAIYCVAHVNGSENEAPSLYTVGIGLYYNSNIFCAVVGDVLQ